MNFIHEKERIYLNDEQGSMIAEIIFPIIDENTVKVTRTYVDSKLQGKGIAGMLMQELVGRAKNENKRIVPACSYALQWSKKHEEYSGIFVL